MSTELTKVVILGAAGRDFHDFNMLYRDDPAVRVVAFIAAQIPGIAGRRYPVELAGPRYPEGIPIVDENELEALARVQRIDRVVFAYSDVPHAHVMHLASPTLAMGADFQLPGPQATMLRSLLPVIAVSAVRTGCGKSAASLWLARRLHERGLQVAVLRHPMPYGDLLRERVQRFAGLADLDAADCTLEEREEYEPHLAVGNVVFAGVDYAAILSAAEVEADIIIWATTTFRSSTRACTSCSPMRCVRSRWRPTIPAKRSRAGGCAGDQQVRRGARGGPRSAEPAPARGQSAGADPACRRARRAR
jgi:predicted GTPase